MSSDDFLAKLQGVKKSGKGWMARCPAHDDSSASLSIADAKNHDSLVLKCHAGCSTEAIVSALGLEMADLFVKEKSSLGEIAATYDYKDASGKLLYQVIRYLPKDFRQRRPDGAGGWIWNLTGVQRVLYRLPELAGKEAVVICEGEKDVDRLCGLKVVATTNAGGAGGWIADYTQQLLKAGVKRVAILPDNDAPGRSHADTVASSVHAAGIQARIVLLPDLPIKGDVSDYLDTRKTIAELSVVVKQAPLWEPGRATPAPPERLFRSLPDNEHQLDILSSGIEFHVTRLRRSSNELWGELTVTLTKGHFPHAPTLDGVLSVSEMNFTSQTARVTRAKFLKDRCGTDGESLDWVGFVEELSIKTIKAERHGEPSIVLADFPTAEDEKDSWEFQGFPVLRRHPTVLLGKGATGKSYFAMWIAGQLAQQGISVAYLDWELAGDDHRTRVERLFQPVPREIHYIRCNAPLREQMDRIQRILREKRCTYAVFDSVGPASRAGGGRFQDGDLGQEYFGLVRRLEVGSLHVAHPAKHVEDDKDVTIYGSAFFGYLTRSLWLVKAAETNPHGQLHMGFHHHKLTTGAKLESRAYRLVFEDKRTRIEATDLKQNEELVAGLSLLERILVELKTNGPMTAAGLAENLGSQKNVVRAILSRHKSKFVKNGQKFSLMEHHDGETEF